MNTKYAIGAGQLMDKLDNCIVRYELLGGKIIEDKCRINPLHGSVDCYFPLYLTENGKKTLNKNKQGVGNSDNNGEESYSFQYGYPYMVYYSLMLFMSGGLRYNITPIVKDYKGDHFVSGTVIFPGVTYKNTGGLDINYKKFHEKLIAADILRSDVSMVCKFSDDDFENMYLLMCAMSGDMEALNAGSWREI